MHVSRRRSAGSRFSTSAARPDPLQHRWQTMTTARGSEGSSKASAMESGKHDDAGVDVDGYLRAKKTEVDRALASVLPLADAPRPLADAMHYSVMAGGKRL